MPSPSSNRRPERPRAFTIIELLTVIAIIGILAAVLIPTLTGSQVSAKRAKTRVQFNQWAVAIEGFRQEYGYYPDFTTFTDGKISDATKAQQFIQTLTGRKLDGTALAVGDPGLLAGNTKRITFCSFGQGDLTAASEIQDAFGNTSIVVLMDRNGDGFVRDNTGTNPDYPSSAAPGFGALLVNFPPAGVRAGVIFYSPGAGQSDADIVKSW